MSKWSDIFYLGGDNGGLGGHNCCFYPIEWTLTEIARTTDNGEEFVSTREEFKRLGGLRAAGRGFRKCAEFASAGEDFENDREDFQRPEEKFVSLKHYNHDFTEFIELRRFILNKR